MPRPLLAGGPRFTLADIKDPKLKVAIVHYWLIGMRGGEQVLESICRLFPDADIFTLVIDREQISPTILKHRITASFLQRIGGRRFYKKMLPLMPFALEQFDLSGYDLIISSEAGPAKGIIPDPDALHVCYCHTPMRYVWDLHRTYRDSAGPFGRLIFSLTAPALRQWDVSTAARVDHFVANSAFVARRIEKYYRRSSTVIYPPVDIDRFHPVEAVEDFYICAGQVTPYKKVDTAIEAFTRMGKPLLIIGAGAEHLRSQAGPTVKFLGRLPPAELADYFARCRALIYPGIEDFGIIPIEVMASGRPVIAYRRGGAGEAVDEGLTGILFDEQTPESLIDAVQRFEAQLSRFDPQKIRCHAVKYNRSRFETDFATFIAEKLNENRARQAPLSPPPAAAPQNAN